MTEMPETEKILPTPCDMCISMKHDTLKFNCNHAYCSKCIYKIVLINLSSSGQSVDLDKEIKYKCCICQYGELVLSNKSLLDFIEARKTKEEKDQKCYLHHKDFNAICITCKYKMCQSCIYYHDESHDISFMKDLKLSKQTCHNHRTKINFQCTTCDKQICEICKGFEHSNHSTVEISEYYETIKQNLNTVQLPFKIDSVESLLELMSNEETKVMDNLRNEFLEIKNEVSDLISYLYDCKDLLKEKLDKLEADFPKTNTIIAYVFKKYFKDILRKDKDNNDFQNLEYLKKFSKFNDKFELTHSVEKGKFKQILLKMQTDISTIKDEIKNIEIRSTYIKKDLIMNETNRKVKNVNAVVSETGYGTGYGSVYGSNTGSGSVYGSNTGSGSVYGSNTGSGTGMTLKPVNSININGNSIKMNNNKSSKDSKPIEFSEMYTDISFKLEDDFPKKKDEPIPVKKVSKKVKQDDVEHGTIQHTSIKSNTQFKCIKTLNGHTAFVSSVIQLSNGFFASGSSDKSIKIWDPNHEYRCVKRLKGHTDCVFAVIQLKNGFIASGCKANIIKIWDPNFDYKCVTTIVGHTSSVYSLIVIDNKLFASGSGDSHIKIWDSSKDYKCVKTLFGHKSFVYSLAKLKNGFLVSGSGDCNIKFWDPNNDYKCVKVLDQHVSTVYSITQLSNGLLVSGSGDGLIKLWDISENYECIHTVEAHSSSIYSIIQLRNGMIASASGDFSIKIWDPDNNYTCVKTLHGHDYIVYSITELNNGALVSGSGDFSIKLWH